MKKLKPKDLLSTHYIELKEKPEDEGLKIYRKEEISPEFKLEQFKSLFEPELYER